MTVLAVPLLVFGFFTLVSAESSLFCYQCTPPDNCSTHVTAQLYDCYSDLGDSTSKIDVSCFAAFLNYTGVYDYAGNPRDPETGAYRGCGIIPSNLGEYCAWYRAELIIHNITITTCVSCNTSRCNRHIFDLLDGSITGIAPPDESSSCASTMSLVLLVISLSVLYI